MASNHILVVDDEPDIRQLVQEILQDEGYSVATAQDAEHARKALLTRRPDLILLDIWMPDTDGISLLQEWAQTGLPCPVIMMSGHGTVETAVEATRSGAYDFLEKPLSLAKLLLTVERAIEANRLERENQGLRERAEQPDEPIGHSEIMSGLRADAQRIAQNDAWILMTGEPGVGKATLARYIHAHSARREGPFVEVRVGSIAPENSSRELFGSEQGGKLHYGRLEQANSGILFLDDIADMDLASQARLVSALDGEGFLRVGGDEPVQTDVRIIAASHQDLAKAVSEGRFREDLYYRLNVLPLRIPPLRDHREDVPELLNFYMDKLTAHENLPYKHLTVAAQNKLRNYDWPGNVRELRNLVQRLLILTPDDEIGPEHVEQVRVESASAQVPESAGQGGASIDAGFYQLNLREAREAFERSYMEYHLKQNDGSVAKLAKVAGMERTNLYRKLRSLGIEIK
ncbi:MAG: sigma-54-dependent transcriptional regulator [Gammaproteobacteria bacterium]